MMRWMMFVFVCLAGGVASLYAPWWVIAPVALVGGLVLPCSPGKSLVAGIFAFGLLWSGGAAYFHQAGDGIVAARIAAMLGIGHPWLLVVLCGIIGGVVGGVATLAGSFLRTGNAEIQRPRTDSARQS